MEYILLTVMVFDTLVVMSIVMLSGAASHRWQDNEAEETPQAERMGEAFSNR